MIFRAYLDLLIEAQVLRAGRGFASDSDAVYYSGKIVALLPLLHGCVAAVAARQTLQLVTVAPDIKLIATGVVFGPFGAAAVFLSNNLAYFEATERRLRSESPEIQASTRRRVRWFTYATYVLGFGSLLLAGVSGYAR